MKLLALPLTTVVVIIAGIILALSAALNLVFHWVAKFFAMIVVETLIWQESDFLLKLASTTQRKQEETAGNRLEEHDKKL